MACGAGAGSGRAVRRPRALWTLALGTTAIGILIDVVVIVIGLLGYLEPSVVGIDIRLAARHGIRTEYGLVYVHGEDGRCRFVTDHHLVYCPLPRAGSISGVSCLCKASFSAPGRSTSNSRNNSAGLSKSRRKKAGLREPALGKSKFLRRLF